MVKGIQFPTRATYSISTEQSHFYNSKIIDDLPPFSFSTSEKMHSFFKMFRNLTSETLLLDFHNNEPESVQWIEEKSHIRSS